LLAIILIAALVTISNSYSFDVAELAASVRGFDAVFVVKILRCLMTKLLFLAPAKHIIAQVLACVGFTSSMLPASP
jgi:hypothetical protein